MAKKSASGSGTIRKKILIKNGKKYEYWEARFTAGRDPGTGKQIQRSITGKTQKEVAQKLKAATTEVDVGTYVEPSKLTLSQWLDIWADNYLIEQKYGTVKHYKAQIKTHIKPALGAVKLQSLRANDIQAFYKKMLTEGKIIQKQNKETGKVEISKEPLSPKSVRNIHVVLNHALTQAVDIGYLSRSPMRGVVPPKVPKTVINIPDDDDIQAYFEAVEDNKYCLILKLILFTGMRESEAMGLTLDCVDYDKGTIKVCKQLQDLKKENGGMTLVPTKNDRTRVISVAPYVIDIIKQAEKKQIESRLLAGECWLGWQTESERKKSLLFTNEFGRPLRPKTIWRNHKNVCIAAGIPETRVHDLRHTFAVLSLQNGDDIKTLQLNLGHASAAFTLDVYGHVSQRMDKNSAERMQTYIEALKN